MNLEEFNIIVFVTGIILGGAISLAFKSLTSKNTNKQPISNSGTVSIKSLQQELDKKQVIIDNFFADSNEQLTMVEKRLAELRTNLESGAGQISNINITKRTASIETPDTDSIVFEPPRDYALKTDKEQGTLSEKFGLDDKADDLEPVRTV
ncbi:DUF1043 domain-containing protein [Marinomonas transparens]|uniref:DUF1043 domain-containing protein n=1 Tax=Marinomonas transparens TaxID=2795388 RepID=A0A934N2E6_9GAMM|nr:DUF1043 domain-containing protein [Marinomonas transparens]MBJ7537728.1 DUF1043 domain-containing protein [Marinomonas transparens]